MINSQQCLFVRVGIVFSNRIDDVRHFWSVHHLNTLDAAGANRFRYGSGKFLPGLNDDFTSTLMIRRINDVVTRDLVFNLRNAAAT